jgi:hypothetical protein
MTRGWSHGPHLTRQCVPTSLPITLPCFEGGRTYTLGFLMAAGMVQSLWTSWQLLPGWPLCVHL